MTSTVTSPEKREGHLSSISADRQFLEFSVFGQTTAETPHQDVAALRGVLGVMLRSPSLGRGKLDFSSFFTMTGW